MSRNKCPNNKDKNYIVLYCILFYKKNIIIISPIINLILHYLAYYYLAFLRLAF